MTKESRFKFKKALVNLDGNCFGVSFLEVIGRGTLSRYQKLQITQVKSMHFIKHFYYIIKLGLSIQHLWVWEYQHIKFGDILHLKIWIILLILKLMDFLDYLLLFGHLFSLKAVKENKLL